MKKFWVGVGGFLGGIAAIIVLLFKVRENRKRAQKIAASQQTYVHENDVDRWHKTYEVKAESIEETLNKATVEEVVSKWRKAFGDG